MQTLKKKGKESFTGSEKGTLLDTSYLSYALPLKLLSRTREPDAL